MSAAPESLSDVSSGVINSLSQLGYAFGTAVAGSVLLSQFYGTVVTEVRLVAGGDAVTRTERRQLAVRLADARETTTPAQQEAFVSGLTPDRQQELVEIVQTSMVTAQRSVPVVLVVFALGTLVVSSFRPDLGPGRDRFEAAADPGSDQPIAAKNDEQ